MSRLFVLLHVFLLSTLVSKTRAAWPSGLAETTFNPHERSQGSANESVMGGPMAAELTYFESLVEKRAELAPGEPVVAQKKHNQWMLEFTELVGGRPKKKTALLRLNQANWILGGEVTLQVGDQVLQGFQGLITHHPKDESQFRACRLNLMEVSD